MKVACLGPAGTHSEAALTSSGIKNLEPLLCTSIAMVFDFVASGKAEAGFVPIENLLEGPVVETLDQLLEHKDKLKISESFNYKVEHSLGVLSGFKGKQKELKAVYSHPQVLGQCAGYLKDNLPNSRKCAMDSSSAAATFLKENQMPEAGVLGLKATLEKEGFRILADNISDNEENNTRFVLIKKGKETAPEKDEELKPENYVTSILVEPEKDRTGLLFELLSIISEKHRVNIRSIHSRPDSKGGFVFFLDLQGHPGSSSIKNCIKDLREISPVDSGMGTKISIAGSWQNTPLASVEPLTVGIIGAKGKMGGWFSKFFSSSGYSVIESDKGSNVSTKELAESSDVILLSVPMASLQAVVDEIKPHLRPGQLVVENCSVKDCSLDTILEDLPKGVECLAIHTMFGEKISSLTGENIVVTSTTSSGPLSDKLENLFEKRGAIVSRVSPDQHSEATALVQSLVHSILLAFGEACSKTGQSAEELKKMSTPNSRAIISAMERVASQDKELLLTLQSQNPKAHEARRVFLQSYFDLVFSLFRGETKALEQALKATKSIIKE